MRLDFDGDGLQTAVIAGVSALPAAVAHPCRYAETAVLSAASEGRILRKHVRTQESCL
jgi:hypothetical protein